MKNYKLNFLFILILSVLVFQINAQNTIADNIWEIYPDYINFESEVYIEKLDSCFLITDLNHILIFNEEIKSSNAIIETLGLKPINTSVKKIVESVPEIYSSKCVSYPKGEFSKRRINFTINKQEYTCLDNYVFETNVKDEIIGLYKNIENYYLLIKDEKLFLIEKIKSGYSIKLGVYSIIGDRLTSTIDEKYLWNRKTNKVEFSSVVEEQFSVETCFLLNDCIQNHTTVLISMYIIWTKSESNEFKELIRIINDYSQY